MTDLAFIVDKCVEDSVVPSKPKWLEELGGFYGHQFQEFLYRLGHYDFRYLEIGVYQGASLLSYAAGGATQAYGIDNFKFMMASHTLVQHEAKIHNVQINLIKGDCWSWDTKRIAPHLVQVYYYDGFHQYNEQKHGILDYSHKFANEVLLIVDDFNWSQPQEGTLDAIDELEKQGWEQTWSRVIWSRTELAKNPAGKILLSPVRQKDGSLHLDGFDKGDKQGWWNGVGLFVLQKNGKQNAPMQPVETKEGKEVEKTDELSA